MRGSVNNLVHNAIKYSPAAGLITVTIAVDRPVGLTEQTTVPAGLTTEPVGRATVAVRDPDIGIPPADQPRLVGRFVRAENARGRGINGTGLGLFLCRELIEHHGGRIWFESTDGQGSTFCFTLPLAAADDPEYEPEPEHGVD